MLNTNEVKWKSELEKKTKLRTYVNFKDSYEQEYYVNSILSTQERSLLAQFWCGILPLKIKTGRFNLVRDSHINKFRRLDAYERTCQLSP